MELQELQKVHPSGIVDVGDIKWHKLTNNQQFVCVNVLPMVRLLVKVTQFLAVVAIATIVTGSTNIRITSTYVDYLYAVVMVVSFAYFYIFIQVLVLIYNLR